MLRWVFRLLGNLGWVCRKWELSETFCNGVGVTRKAKGIVCNAFWLLFFSFHHSGLREPITETTQNFLKTVLAQGCVVWSGKAQCPFRCHCRKTLLMWWGFECIPFLCSAWWWAQAPSRMNKDLCSTRHQLALFFYSDIGLGGGCLKQKQVFSIHTTPL